MDRSGGWKRCNCGGNYSATANNICEVGIPETVMTDNGPCFSSRKFYDFVKNNCLVHIRSAPYHGMAERAVHANCEARSKEDDIWNAQK